MAAHPAPPTRLVPVAPDGATLPCAAHVAIVEAVGIAAWLVDAVDARVVAVNEAALALLGRPREALLGAPASTLLVSLEDEAWWEACRREVTAAGAAPVPSLAAALGVLQSMNAVIVPDGTLRHVERRIHPLPLDGRLHLLVSVLDRSDDQRVERERERLMADLRSILESSADGMLVTDLAGQVRAFNHRYADLWAVPQAVLAQPHLRPHVEWMLSRTREPMDDARRHALLAEAALARCCDRLVLDDGRVVERVAVPQLHGEMPVGRLYTFRDLSDRLDVDRRIERLSYTDFLTGLPNRRYLESRLGPALALGARESYGVALLFVDLDRFKRLNDSLGSAAGDRVLREVAQRLKACVRESDLIARVAGDQFVLVLHHADVDGAQHGARRVLDAVARPFTFDATPFTVTCSVGVAVFPQDAADGDSLIGHAETAMQQAKAAGRQQARLHRHRDDADDRRGSLALDHAMRQALVANRFRLHYQPQVDLATGRVVGAEALLRWRDPERGEVSPGTFIPVAEASGFIVALGDWVLGRAVQQAAAWRDAGLPVPIAVNVSALQFQHDDFVDRVGRALEEAALEPALLELELTETILLHNVDDALARLQALSGLGVQLTLDDFGIGYSSLDYLRRFPVHKLKIDRTFVRGLPEDKRDAGIVRAMVQMAGALGLRVVAEGVETPGQRAFLHEAGCHEFQGFLEAPALDAPAFARHARRLAA